MTPRPHCVFKRLETDLEFWTRIAPPKSVWPTLDGQRIRGELLDQYAWDALKKQRRIVEDQT